MISKSEVAYRWNNHLTTILKRIFFVFSPLVVLPLPSHCQRDIFSLKGLFFVFFVVVVFGGGGCSGTWWCLYFDAGSTTKIIFYLNFVWNLRFNFFEFWISYFSRVLLLNFEFNVVHDFMECNWGLMYSLMPIKGRLQEWLEALKFEIIFFSFEMFL